MHLYFDKIFERIDRLLEKSEDIETTTELRALRRLCIAAKEDVVILQRQKESIEEDNRFLIEVKAELEEDVAERHYQNEYERWKENGQLE